MSRGVVVPVGLLAVAERQAGLVSFDQCDAHGLSRGARARLLSACRWRRPTQGVFDTVALPASERHPDDRRRRAAWLGLLAYGPNAIAVGACALALHAVAGLPGVVAPEVAMPAGTHLRSRDGIRVRQLGDVPTVVSGGRRIATIEAALVHALPGLRRHEVVAVLDSALNKRLLDLEGMARIRRQLRGRRGAVRLEPWWGLVDGRSESPLETDARLRCHDAGIPPDDLQVVIRDDDGRFVGRGDLGWRLRDGRWLLVEIDGREVHDSPRALYADRTRQNRLLLTGRVELLRFTRADFQHHLIPTIRQHLLRYATDRGRAGGDARVEPRKRASPPAGPGARPEGGGRRAGQRGASRAGGVIGRRGD